MVEALANQPARRQQNAGRIGRQRVQAGHQRGSLLPGHSAMQDERNYRQTVKCRLDRVEMFGTLGQDEHLAPLLERVTHLNRDSPGPVLVRREMPEQVLDAGMSGNLDPGEP